MSILVEEQNLIKSYSNKKDLSVEQAQIDQKVLKTNPNISNNNIDNQLNLNKNKLLLEDGNKNKNSAKKRMEILNVNYTEGKNLREKTSFKNENINKTSSLTPKNISKFPRLSKNLNLEKIDKTLSNNKKSNLESERSKKQRNESEKTIIHNNHTKDSKRQDTSVSNLNKTRDEKKDDAYNKNTKNNVSSSPFSHNTLNAKMNAFAKNNNNLQNKLIKESKSTQQLLKLKEAKEKTNPNQIEAAKDYQEKAPLIDLGTDFYEGAEVVEIDIGISYNSSINNNSLLNSKNYNEENLKKSKLDSITKINNTNNYLENFEGSLENINDKLNDEVESDNSINEFKLNVNTGDEIKYKKILIENLEEINIEEDLGKTSPTKKPNYYKTSKASGIQSSPSTKNFMQNNLNSGNNTIKYIKTNFESTRNANTNLNLNSNKNLIAKKCTIKNSFNNNSNNTNTLKSEDASNNKVNCTKEKTKEKFPHSKTLKILKNDHLNFMNNAFKVLTDTQGNLNYNKFEKAKTLLTFSKEKDNQLLSFRVTKKNNTTQLKNLMCIKKDAVKNSSSVKPFQDAFSKKKIKGSDNFNNLEIKRTTSNNRSLLSNKLIFNTTTDLKEEIKKPYSQDKDLSKRKFITDKSLNKKDLKDSLSKNNLNFVVNNEQNKNKKRYDLNLKKNQAVSKKKFEKGKNDNLFSNHNKKATENKLSDITFISNKNVKDSNLRNHEKKTVKRKSVSNNPLSYKNDVNSNTTTNLNINCTINNTNTNNNNYVLTVNQTIGNTNSEKNFNTVKNNANINTKQSLNKSNNNINNDKKPKVNNYVNDSNNYKNQKENMKNHKLSHNISQKYLKQFFSSLTNNTIIGNVNVNISNSNLKITQNIPAQENTNFNASFKSNYRNSEIPIKNNIEISFESADETNLNENVFIEEPKLAKSIKKDKDSKQKNVNSPPLIVAKRAINKMLNSPVSEYKFINLRDYNMTDDNQILLNYSENLDVNVHSKNLILTENAENNCSKNNLNTLKNNLSDKHFDRINMNLIDKNAVNANKGRINNTYRNTLNINLNSKKNFLSHNNNSNNNFERANTFSNQNKTSLSSKQAAFKKLDSEVKLNEASLSTTEISIFKGKMDDYSIGKEIGKGAYAIVKHAIHKPTNRKFAIKIYEKVKLLDAERKGSVKREIQILKKMDHHDNIVKLIEVIETTRQILLVMELVEGISLLDLLKSRENRRIDENECRKIFSQLVNAIAFCHSKNIIHRDIKLENIIVDPNFNLKLIDFGFGAVSPSNKLQSFFCGTPSYMPPEIVQKKDYIGYLTDIWSLGILLFTLLCGAFPFRANSEKELYGKIIKGIFSCPEHLSQSVCELIKKILVIKPTDRPSAQDMLNDKWFNSFYSHHKNVEDCIILEENELNFNSKNN